MGRTGNMNFCVIFHVYANIQKTGQVDFCRRALSTCVVNKYNKQTNKKAQKKNL